MISLKSTRRCPLGTPLSRLTPTGQRSVNCSSRRDILPAMSDVTQILLAIDQGDPHAAEQLLPLVYDELRRLERR
jgi:hypothetical protein